MSANHSDTLVVGAGQSAMAVARNLRELGYAGSVTLVGEEIIAPYERPPLSKDFLTQVPTPAPVLFAEEGWWRAQGVDLLLGERVSRIEPAIKQVRLASGSTLTYDRLVIATGGIARQAGPGVTLRTVADARRLTDLFSIAKSVCVVGGGFLGLEIAASARTRGLESVVLEAAPRLLPNVLPPSLSQWLRTLHAKHGTQVHCGTAVTTMQETTNGRFTVVGTTLRIEADCLVAAVGMQPNTTLAEQAGLAVREGIVVDELCRTSALDIYAVGDAASVIDAADGLPRRVESWQNANYQGALVAAGIADKPLPRRPVSWFWTEQYGQSIQVLGHLAGGGELVWRGSPDDASFVAIYLLEGRLAGAVGVNAGRDIAPLRQLIAANATVPLDRLASAHSMRDVLADVRRTA